MNYSIDRVLYGSTKNMIIVSRNNEYHVPIAVYRTSLKNPPNCVEEFRHSIEPTIKCYTDADIQLVVYFMHCAALPMDIKARKYDVLDIQNVQQLPHRLAVLSWCDDMIKSSESYANYKSSTIESIKQMVSIIRAIVSDGIDDRFSWLEKSGLPFSIPDYLNHWILLPCGPNNDNKNKDPKVWKQDMISNINMRPDSKFGINSGGGIHLDKSGYENHYLYKTYAKTNITGSDIVAKQQQLINDIISRELRIMCYEHPEYLKLDGFDDSCIEYIYSIIDETELMLHCKSKPQMTICDVFRYGLAAALAADYE